MITILKVLFESLRNVRLDRNNLVLYCSENVNNEEARATTYPNVFRVLLINVERGIISLGVNPSFVFFD